MPVVVVVVVIGGVAMMVVTLVAGMATWLETAQVVDVLVVVVEEVVGLVTHVVHKDTWQETVPVRVGLVALVMGDMVVVVVVDEEASVTTVERRGTLLGNALANPSTDHVHDLPLFVISPRNIPFLLALDMFLPSCYFVSYMTGCSFRIMFLGCILLVSS